MESNRKVAKVVESHKHLFSDDDILLATSWLQGREPLYTQRGLCYLFGWHNQIYEIYGGVLPFNKNFLHYHHEKCTKTLHLNKNRIAFVRAVASLKLSSEQ